MILCGLAIIEKKKKSLFATWNPILERQVLSGEQRLLYLDSLGSSKTISEVLDQAEEV